MSIPAKVKLTIWFYCVVGLMVVATICIGIKLFVFPAAAAWLYGVPYEHPPQKLIEMGIVQILAISLVCGTVIWFGVLLQMSSHKYITKLDRNIKKTAWACVYVNQKFILVESRSGYVEVEYDPKGYECFLEPTASDQELGQAIADALAASRFIVEPPTSKGWIHPEAIIEKDWSQRSRQYERDQAWVKRLLDRYGYNDKNALLDGMVLCSITKTEGQLAMYPWRREQSHGFSMHAFANRNQIHQPAAIVPDDSSAQAIGQALRKALNSDA